MSEKKHVQDHGHEGHGSHGGHGHGEPFFGGKILTGILIAVFLITFILVFVVPTVSINAADKDIRIAVLIPLTGELGEDYGLIFKDGIDMAADELVRSGTNLHLQYYDTESDASIAQDKFFEAVSDGYEVVLGPFLTAEAEVIAPYAEMYKIVLLTQVTGPSITEYNKYVFRFVPSNYNFCFANVVFLENYNVSEITVIWAPNTLGRSTYEAFAEVAKEEGITVNSVPLTSFEDVAESLNTLKPDWVYFIPETPEQLSDMMSYLVAENVTISKLAVATDDAFGPQVRDNVDALGINVLMPSLSTANPVFKYNYKQRFGRDFDVSNGYALYGYDGLKTLVDAMEWTDNFYSGKDVAETLKEYRNLGLTGSIVFDENLDRFPSYETYEAGWGTWYLINLVRNPYLSDYNMLASYTSIRQAILDAYHSGNPELARSIMKQYWV